MIFETHRSVASRFVDVATMEAKTGSTGQHAYCVETNNWYRYEASASAYTRDGTSILDTAAGGDTRWLGEGPAYVVGSESVRINQSTAPLSSELTTNGSFTTDLTGWSGANWAWASGDKALHTAGSTAALTQNINVTNGTTYHIAFTISGRTAGSVSISIGGVSIYNYSTTTGFTANAADNRTLVAGGVTGAQALNITPTSDFDGSIEVVSVKAITGTATVFGSYVDEGSGTVIEVRGTASLYNQYFGANSGRSNTAGYSNSVGAGVDALRSNTTGYENSVGAGVFALYSNTTGYNNSVGAGVDALRSNTTGSSNSVGAGVFALYSNTTGYQNSVGAGVSALRSNTTGYNNSVGAGVNALRSNTTGYNNSVGAGVFALRSNTTGYSNSVGAGANALYSNTTGYSNSVGAGANALYSNTTGAKLTAIGFEAGYTSGTVDGSVFVGHQAGYYETAANKLFIDNVKRTDEADGRAKSLIYGLFDAAIANQFVQINGKFACNGVTPGAQATYSEVAADIAACLVAHGLMAAA